MRVESLLALTSMRESEDHETRYTAATCPLSVATNLTPVISHHRLTQRGTSNSLARPTLPKLDGVIESSTRDPPPIRRESDVVDLLLVSRQTRDRLLGVLPERGPEEEGVVV